MAIAELRPTARETASTAKRPLRVCHVSLTLKTGGLERILTDIARHHDSAETVDAVEEGTPKNDTMPQLSPVDISGEPSLEQDVQLQKAVEMLKTWKIFKELPRAS